MGQFKLQQKIFRDNPKWVYIISQIKKEIPVKPPWWNKKLVIKQEFYEITVKGGAIDEIDRLTDFHDFDQMLEKALTGLELENFVDGIHAKIRAGRSEQDWEKLEREKIEKEKAIMEEKMRLEMEKRIAEEKARLEKELKEKYDKEKIEIALADNSSIGTDIKA